MAKKQFSDFITVVHDGYKIPNNKVNKMFANSINKEAINNLNVEQLNRVADILGVNRKPEKVYKDAINKLKKNAFK